MKDRLRIWPMKALAAFALAAGLAPVPVLLGRWLFPESPCYWFFPFFLAYLWGTAGYLLPRKLRIPWTAAGCALAVAGAALVPRPFAPQNLLLAAPCAALLLLLPPAWARPAWEEWQPGWWIACIGLHLAGQTLAGRPAFSGTRAPLMAVFLIFVFLDLMYLNRNSIREGMHGAEKAPASLRYRNTALVAGLFLLGAAASAWGTLARWLDASWYYVRLGVGYVIFFLMSLLPTQSVSGSPATGMEGGFSGFGETAETSAFALFMEKVFRVLAFLLLAVVLFFALRALIRKLRLLWRKILERLRRYAAAANEDYVDEAESTLNWDEKTQSIRERMKEALQRTRKQPKWEELDGRGRVRRLYLQYIQRKPDAQGKTVREALGQDQRLAPDAAGAFTNLYEQARYSDHDISTQDADKLRGKLS